MDLVTWGLVSACALGAPEHEGALHQTLYQMVLADSRGDFSKLANLDTGEVVSLSSTRHALQLVHAWQRSGQLVRVGIAQYPLELVPQELSPALLLESCSGVALASERLLEGFVRFGSRTEHQRHRALSWYYMGGSGDDPEGMYWGAMVLAYELPDAKALQQGELELVGTGDRTLPKHSSLIVRPHDASVHGAPSSLLKASRPKGGGADDASVDEPDAQGNAQGPAPKQEPTPPQASASAESDAPALSPDKVEVKMSKGRVRLKEADDTTKAPSSRGRRDKVRIPQPPVTSERLPTSKEVAR